MHQTITRYLPADDAQRIALHDEIHARPSATLRLPALVVYVAVLNKDVDKNAELTHLQKLPSAEVLEPDSIKGNFLQLQCTDYKVTWERHTEFTQYTIFQSLPPHAHWVSQLPELTPYAAMGPDWLRNIPRETNTAIHLAMLNEGMEDPDAFAKARQWLGEGTVIGSRMGRASGNQSHSHLMTNLRIGADGFERILVLAAPATSLNRSGRIAQRASDLLRTRVDIATETHNQQLLEKLTKGQATQLRLQTTVEGLSIAVISYYVVSLTLYLGKALQATGMNVSPEMLADFSTPVVLFVCWRMVQKIHRSLQDV